LFPPGVNGGMFYAASDICNGPANRLKEAQMSFPSGHACAAFAGFGYLTLWLNAHFKILSNGRRFREIFKDREEEEGILTIGRRVSHWKLPMVMTPLCVAVLVAGSKVRDMWHHPIDVVVGALIGLTFAHVAYKMVYRSVYDWRDNHVPLGVGAKEEEEDEKERRKEV
jgi:diacylglycerol diphosphate phosphatase/phosphatidate phosphatase